MGAIVPIIAAMLSPRANVGMITTVATLITLTALGCTAAYAGGASILKGAIRVTFWGALAMGVTALVGKLMGAAI